MIIGLAGFAGSGKSTAAQYFIDHHGFRRLSFAAAVKDTAAAIFGWDRAKLEGATDADRTWREQPDPFWSVAMKQPWTPRYALQYVGTDLCRNHVLDTIWIERLRNNILLLGPNAKVVIDDVRFVNERDALRTWGAHLLTIDRPSQYGPAQRRLWAQAIERKESLSPVPGPFSPYPEEATLHISEWQWLTDPRVSEDSVILNDGTTQHFHDALSLWYTTTMQRTLHSEEIYA